jgi:hypothetical protein
MTAGQDPQQQQQLYHMTTPHMSVEQSPQLFMTADMQQLHALSPLIHNNQE